MKDIYSTLKNWNLLVLISLFALLSCDDPEDSLDRSFEIKDLLTGEWVLDEATIIEDFGQSDLISKLITNTECTQNTFLNLTGNGKGTGNLSFFEARINLEDADLSSISNDALKEIISPLISDLNLGSLLDVVGGPLGLVQNLFALIFGNDLDLNLDPILDEIDIPSLLFSSIDTFLDEFLEAGIIDTNCASYEDIDVSYEQTGASTYQLTYNNVPNSNPLSILNGFDNDSKKVNIVLRDEPETTSTYGRDLFDMVFLYESVGLPKTDQKGNVVKDEQGNVEYLDPAIVPLKYTFRRKGTVAPK